MYKRQEATLQGKEFSKLPLTHPAKAYKSIADRISVSTTGTTDVAMLDSTRIIVPPNAIQGIMKELHRAHSGIEKMYKTAVQLYFWPGMKNTIILTYAESFLLPARSPIALRSTSQTSPAIPGRS